MQKRYWKPALVAAFVISLFGLFRFCYQPSHSDHSLDHSLDSKTLPVAGESTSPGYRSGCSTSSGPPTVERVSSGCSSPSLILLSVGVAGAVMEARKCYPCARSGLSPMCPVASFGPDRLHSRRLFWLSSAAGIIAARRRNVRCPAQNRFDARTRVVHCCLSSRRRQFHRVVPRLRDQPEDRQQVGSTVRCL